MPSFTKPTKEDVSAAVPSFSSPEHERYFFTRLKNPLWINLLREQRCFDNSPSSEPVKGGGTRNPRWPPSEYLARMAPIAPDEVVDILEQIKTDNRIIAGDILNAAKSMPGQQGKRLVPLIVDFVCRDVLWAHLKDIAELSAKLAREGEPDSAMSLVRDAISIPTKKERGRQRDDYWYIEGLKKDVIPALIPVRPKQLLKHLCEEVKRAIPTRDYSTRDPDNDNSCWWRPAIEEHKQNADFQLRSKVVACVRQACELAISKEHLALTEVLELLSSRQMLVFRRLRVHLIRVFADQAVELARRKIMDRELFADRRYKHEYALLVGERFPLLTEKEKSTWLGWVDEGPEGINPEFYHKEASAETREGQKEWWQAARLLWVRQYLSPERKTFVEERFADEDDEGLAFFNVYSSDTAVGQESPSEAEKLSDMGFERAVEFIANWRPESSPHIGRPVKGLAQTFGVYVASDPAGFSAKASLLKNRPAIYVRSFLHAMESAVKASASIDVSAILDLCKWVTEQPVDQDTSPTQEEDGLVDRNWLLCRDAIAELVQEICKQRPELKHRDAIWEVIEPLLTASPESYVVQDEDEDPRVTDYGTLFITSPLGNALKAVFEYARWIAKSEARKKGDQEVYEKGLAFMPDVRAVLAAGIAPDSNFRFIGRAAYGWFIGLLYWIDKKWLENHATEIFDLRQIEREPATAYGWAAWNSFLQYNHPHKELYGILAEQFSYAVDHVANLEEPEEDPYGPVDRLGEHLMVLYGRGDLGELSSGTDQQIVERFLTTASRPVRSRAVEFVGKSLRHEGKEPAEELPEAVQNRFMKLWDWYWKHTGEDDASADPVSGLFGWWFVSQAFPVEWSIKRLEAFVSVVPKPEPDSFIVERLAKLTRLHPHAAVRILRRMVDGDDENWRVSSWREEAQSVLKQAIGAGGEARKAAESLIDQLGRRGFVEFGQLLRG